MAVAAELREITRSTLLREQEMVSMLFDDRLPADVRAKRFLDVIGMGVSVIAFGLALANRYQIEEFRAKMSTVESRMASLIQLNDEIVRTQLRDEETISLIYNSTLM